MNASIAIHGMLELENHPLIAGKHESEAAESEPSISLHLEMAVEETDNSTLGNVILSSVSW